MVDFEVAAVNLALASLKHNIALISDTRWATPSCQVPPPTHHPWQPALSHVRAAPQALQEILANVQHEIKLLDIQNQSLDSHDLENLMHFYPSIQASYKEHVELLRLALPTVMQIHDQYLLMHLIGCTADIEVCSLAVPPPPARPRVRAIWAPYPDPHPNPRHPHPGYARWDSPVPTLFWSKFRGSATSGCSPVPMPSRTLTLTP